MLILSENFSHLASDADSRCTLAGGGQPLLSSFAVDFLPPECASEASLVIRLQISNMYNHIPRKKNASLFHFTSLFTFTIDLGESYRIRYRRLGSLRSHTQEVGSRQRMMSKRGWRPPARVHRLSASRVRLARFARSPND